MQSQISPDACSSSIFSLFLSFQKSARVSPLGFPNHHQTVQVLEASPPWKSHETIYF